MLNPKKGGKLQNQQNPFILVSVYDIYHFPSNYPFWGLPSMSGEFYMHISTINYVTVPTKIYLCVHLYTCVYSACNREVVGSSPTRGELFSRKFWLFQESLEQLILGVSREWLAFRMLGLRHKHVYIYMHLCLSDFLQIIRVFAIWLNQFLM